MLAHMRVRAGVYSGGCEGSSLCSTRAMLLVREYPPVSSGTPWRRNGVAAAPCIWLRKECVRVCVRECMCMFAGLLRFMLAF